MIYSLRSCPCQWCTGLPGLLRGLVKLESEPVCQSGEVVEDADDVGHLETRAIIEAKIP